MFEFLLTFFLVVLLLLVLSIIWRINARKYISSGTVASAYDAWTQDKLLERLWGAHIHLGFYPATEKNIDDFQKLDSLKDSVKEALSDVINLTSKLNNTKKNLPDKLPDTAIDLSFWIGAHLGGPVADEQQRLLEERNTFTRLQREYEMLDHTRKQLAARTALKERFPDIKEN